MKLRQQFLLVGLCLLISINAHAEAPSAETEVSESCPALTKAEEQVCDNRFDCTDGTAFNFTKEYVWKDGNYSVLMDFEGQKVVCRGEISLAACSLRKMLNCEGPYGVHVYIEGCPEGSYTKDDHDHDHGHDHDHPHDYEQNEVFITYKPAQARPYIERIKVVGAADQINLKISRSVKILGGVSFPKTIHRQSFSDPDYKMYQPNGSGCPPVCRIAAELTVDLKAD